MLTNFIRYSYVLLDLLKKVSDFSRSCILLCMVFQII